MYAQTGCKRTTQTVGVKLCSRLDSYYYLNNYIAANSGTHSQVPFIGCLLVKLNPKIVLIFWLTVKQ